MTFATRRLAPLLFGSGMCALVYQVAWFREFRLVFGASTGAHAAVLAVFIGGLGVGGLVLGKRADRHPNPVRFYALLEMMVALLSAATPFALGIARRLYVSLGGASTLGTVGATIARVMLTALVLAAPTFFMGGTFPAAARGAETDDDTGRRNTGLLYGVNAMGAVTGCLLSTFWLLEALGTRMTLWAGALVNAAIALLAMAVVASGPVDAAAKTATPSPVAPRDSAPAPQAPTQAEAPALFALGAAFVTGFVFFLMEMVWYRMLGPILGGTVFTFGLILAVALLGIALGGALYASIGRTRPATLGGFALTCLLEAALLAVPYALGDRVATLTLLLRPMGVLGFSGFILGWTLITLLVVLGPALVSGAQFPMLIALLGRGREDIGRQTGLAYAFNTAGAILGSLAGGFGLLPALSAPGCWRLSGHLLVLLGLAAVVLAVRRDKSLLSWAQGTLPAGLAVATGIMFRAEGPTAVWRHSAIGVGRVDANATLSQLNLRRWMNRARRSVLWETDGVESSVAIDRSNGIAFVVNGKIDGNMRGDAPTQIMGGLVGALLHPEPHNAMVIGLGTGSTAGWLGALPDIERVDVVELEPAVLRVARECALVNQNVLENPKVHITMGDAREALLTSPKTYDLVFSEPSNPYRAGIASLFTEEYYQAIASRLTKGGMLLQWVQAYNVDSTAVRTIYATLNRVFPSVQTWELAAKDLLLVASQEEPTVDVAALRARMQAEPMRTALRVAWRATDVEGVLAHFVANPTLARRIATQKDVQLNTDDRTVIEFGFARTASDESGLSSDDVRDAARKMGADKPTNLRGTVDAARVRDEWAAFRIAEEDPEPEHDGDTEEMQHRKTALSLYLERKMTSALEQWRAQPREPANMTELAVVAELYADAADARALDYIEKVRAFSPIEADAIAAHLFGRQGKLVQAVEQLEAAFTRFRSDPWPWLVVTEHAIDTAGDVADLDARLAERLYGALALPFAGQLQNELRLTRLLAIAPRLSSPTACVDALRSVEPHVPWIRETLAFRADCYAKAKHAAACLAKRELDEYLAQEASPFAAGLGLSAAP